MFVARCFSSPLYLMFLSVSIYFQINVDGEYLQNTTPY